MDYDDPPLTGRSIRGRGQMSSNGRSQPSGYGRQQGPNYQEQLEQLEAEAYSAVLRAFGAQSEAITWAKERLMSDLRKELNIDDMLHRQLLDRVHTDASIQQICRWKKAQELGGNFLPPSPPALEPAPISSGPQGRKKQKLAAAAPQSLPLAPPPPPPPAVVDAVAAAPAPTRPPPPPKRGAAGKKGKKGRGGRAQPAVAAELPIADDAVQELVHPWIGKRIKTRWTNDDGSTQFYESVISDYREDTGEHGLVYDMGTPDESWEWVDLSKIPKQDIIWVAAPPVQLVPRRPDATAGSRGPASRSSLKRAPPARALPPPAGRGRGQAKALPQPPKGRAAGLPHREDAAAGASDVTSPGTNVLAPLEDIVKVDKIEEEDDLQKLEEAKRLAKEREEALRRALAEVGDDSSDEDDDEGDDMGPGPSSLNQSLDREEEPEREASQGDEDDASPRRREEYERDTNFHGERYDQDDEEDEGDDDR